MVLDAARVLVALVAAADGAGVTVRDLDDALVGAGLEAM